MKINAWFEILTSKIPGVLQIQNIITYTTPSRPKTMIYDSINSSNDALAGEAYLKGKLNQNGNNSRRDSSCNNTIRETVYYTYSLQSDEEQMKETDSLRKETNSSKSSPALKWKNAWEGKGIENRNSSRSKIEAAKEIIQLTKHLSNRMKTLLIVTAICLCCIAFKLQHSTLLWRRNYYCPDGSSSSNCNHSNTNIANMRGGVSSANNNNLIAGMNRNTSLRWGIVGLGRVARDFATALNLSSNNTDGKIMISAVAAGSLPNPLQRAKAFASVYHIPTYYGSYEELANDPNVDIVYVATTNQLHYNNTMLMLSNNKNVLVEKPMAMNYEQSLEMFQEAKKRNLFLMTDYWTRFFPAIKYARQIIDAAATTSSSSSTTNAEAPSSSSALYHGGIGQIVAMNGDFGFRTQPTKNDRYLSPETGGGAMLDIGCYLVNMAVMAAPKGSYPATILASGQSKYLGTDYHVDTEAAFILDWGDTKNSSNNNHSDYSSNESFSMIMSGQVSFQRPASFEVTVEGTNGRITINSPANCPESVRVERYRPSVSGPAILETSVVYNVSLPKFNPPDNIEQYPHGAGFTYVIDAIYTCMTEKGIPGSSSPEEFDLNSNVSNASNNIISSSGDRVQHYRKNDLGGCVELEELTIQEQLATAHITDEVMRRIGYWDW